MLEAPSFHIPTINIGNRQKGRIQAVSVINCSPNPEAIASALTKAFSPEFRAMLTSVTNPYDRGNSSETIVPILKEINLREATQKRFYDLP